jgi:hypothetical protein
MVSSRSEGSKLNPPARNLFALKDVVQGLDEAVDLNAAIKLIENSAPAEEKAFIKKQIEELFRLKNIHEKLMEQQYALVTGSNKEYLKCEAKELEAYLAYTKFTKSLILNPNPRIRVLIYSKVGNIESKYAASILLDLPPKFLSSLNYFHDLINYHKDESLKMFYRRKEEIDLITPEFFELIWSEASLRPRPTIPITITRLFLKSSVSASVKLNSLIKISKKLSLMNSFFSGELEEIEFELIEKIKVENKLINVPNAWVKEMFTN